MTGSSARPRQPRDGRSGSHAAGHVSIETAHDEAVAHDGHEDVLTVRDLRVANGATSIIDGVDLTIRQGERVGIIGESGSGKSMTALSIMGLLPEGLVASGSVRLRGVEHDIVGASERQMARVRGKDVAMVFQEPMTALNPTMPVGKQVAESFLVHGTRDRGAAQRDAIDLLDRVGLPDPADAARSFPHQFSGGQRQRIVLALALANDPQLLICDEPTTALDVTVQAKVLELIVRGVVKRQSALLFITHDLAVVATVCERVVVMYGGRVIEAGPVDEVFTRPRHRYTQGLVRSSDLGHTDDEGRLSTIPGTVPVAGRFPSGCVFRSRCTHADERCESTPPWTSLGEDSGHACVHPAQGEEHAIARAGGAR